MAYISLTQKHKAALASQQKGSSYGRTRDHFKAALLRVEGLSVRMIAQEALRKSEASI